MLARVTRVAIKPDQLERTKSITESEIMSDMKDDPGFKGFYILGDRSTGDSMVITMWDTEEHERTSREQVSRRFSMLSDTLAGQPEPSMIYDVIHSYIPEESPAM